MTDPQLIHLALIAPFIGHGVQCHFKSDDEIGDDIE